MILFSVALGAVIRDKVRGRMSDGICDMAIISILRAGVIVLVGCLGLLACAGGPRADHSGCRPADSRAGDSEIMADGIAGFYPERATVKQRLILDAAGSEYDLVGYLVYRTTPFAAYRAVTFAEIGGTIFDLLLTDEGPTIVTIPEGFPENPIREGVMPDIRMAFGIGQAEIDGTLCFSEDGSEVRFVTGRGGNTVTILYSDFRKSEGISRPVPHTIVITNRRWAYTVEATILEIIPEIRTEAVFDLP